MKAPKLVVRFAAVALAALMVPLGAGAAPIDAWPTTHPDNDCTGPEADATPGTPEFAARDQRNQDCVSQRYVDRSFQPLGNSVPTYGQDAYRIPYRHDNIRFHFDLPVIPGVPSAEVYRPCSNAPGDCPNMPAGLQRFDPPYPVVVVFHGFIASKELHRMNTQVFAEAGYMAIGVDGTHPSFVEGVPSASAPNSQRTANGTDVLNWLASSQSGVFGQQADLDRVGFAGHSQGGAATLAYQDNPRVHALIVWDGGTTTTATNKTPIMYQTAEQGFATATSFTSVPGTIEAGAGYADLRSRNVDSFAMTGRATVHVDYNGDGGPGGNRYYEQVSNYLNLAWWKRYLDGRLVFNADNSVKTYQGRTEAQERAFRQAEAQLGYDRLRATYFDDSEDIHNISMGFWDPEKAAASLDPLFGGNVPYMLDGMRIADRLSFYYRHGCFISVPDYVGGGTGGYDDPVAPAHRAATTPAGDIRTGGCPEVS